jgi:hypothetical protein
MLVGGVDQEEYWGYAVHKRSDAQADQYEPDNGCCSHELSWLPVLDRMLRN